MVSLGHNLVVMGFPVVVRYHIKSVWTLIWNPSAIISNQVPSKARCLEHLVFKTQTLATKEGSYRLNPESQNFFVRPYQKKWWCGCNWSLCPRWRRALRKIANCLRNEDMDVAGPQSMTMCKKIGNKKLEPFGIRWASAINPCNTHTGDWKYSVVFPVHSLVEHRTSTQSDCSLFSQSSYLTLRKW